MNIIYIHITVHSNGPKRKNATESSQVVRKVAKPPGQGVRLQSQTKSVLENVGKFFEKEKVCRATINRMAVVKRTAEATGLSKKTIWTIHKEFIACDGQLFTPVRLHQTVTMKT